MKKLAGLAAAGVGALALGVAAPSQAVTTKISGNFEYTGMQYWCDAGTPNFAFSYRTLNITEKTVTFTASGYKPLVETNVSPYWSGGDIFSISPVAGRTITVSAKGSTSGSTFSVSGKVPTSCAGLPSTRPSINWATKGKPTAQPVPSTTTAPKPTTTAPKPTTTAPKPTTSTPAPTSTTTAPKPTTSAPAPTSTEAPAPTSAAPAPSESSKGPKVETDQVASSNSMTPALAAGALGLAAVAAGGTAAVRRAGRR